MDLPGAVAHGALFQGVDLYPLVKSKRALFNQVTVYEPKIVADPIWQNIARDSNIKYIFMAEEFEQADLYDIANMALKNKKALNRFYIAHANEKAFDSKFNELASLPQNDAVYVFKAPQEGLPPYELTYKRVGDYLLGFVPEAAPINLEWFWFMGQANFFVSGYWELEIVKNEFYAKW